MSFLLFPNETRIIQITYQQLSSILSLLGIFLKRRKKGKLTFVSTFLSSVPPSCWNSLPGLGIYVLALMHGLCWYNLG